MSTQMTIDEYTDAVLVRLPKIEDDFDLMVVKRCIVDFHGEGWPVVGAVSYCKCLEHVNPDLNEDYAIRRMKELSAKYRRPNCPIYKKDWAGLETN